MLHILEGWEFMFLEGKKLFQKVSERHQITDFQFTIRKINNLQPTTHIE